MAFAPVTPQRKQRFSSAPRPDFKDFSGPPDGDYVRYVDGLMRWALEEQERQRLTALGDKAAARSLHDSHWGRSGEQPGMVRGVDEQPGSVETPMERLKRKAQAKTEKLQQQAQTTLRKAGATQNKSLAKPAQMSILAMLVGFVLAAIFAPGLLPVVIVAWVVFNVFRAVRAASRSGKS